MLILAALATAGAEELPTVKRGDIVVEPGNRGLRNDLRDQLENYRSSLRTTGLNPRASRLAQGEREQMRQVIESNGYYEAQIIHRVIEEPGEVEGQVQERVQYRIDTGPRYQVLSVSVQGAEVTLPDTWPTSGGGEPLVASAILADQSELQSIIDRTSCYFTLNVSHEVRLQPEQDGGQVVYQVAATDPSTQGTVSFTGQEGVDEAFLRRQTGLRTGVCFSRGNIDQAIINLYETQLFSSVRRSLQRADDGSVAVTFELTQREPRTLSAGIGWDTDQGFGLRAGWEHRNVAGRAQWLELGTELQRDRQTGNIQLTLPGFLDARNTLVWNNSLTHETPENDEFYIGESRATIDRRASRNDTYRYGIAYRRSDERVGDEWETFSLIRLPLSYEFDSVPNEFNPQKGLRYSVGIEPVWSLNGSSDPFYVGSLGWSSFRDLTDDLVIANRLAWTSLWPFNDSADLDRIPTSDKLLGGGGGTLRGYPYRSIGLEGADIGGNHRWQGSLELRGQLSENWGAVVFTDALSVSDEWNPTTDQSWYYSGGFGVRYFTQFAPIRFDLAFPLSRRDSDPAFQIYISLGQSF
ncbi:autotransporter assembly complex protein TamA [Saccharospirillum impatiens]|uniref:autotransporter assembly complex protein TamA n=1 Tax=Saccharospirillum impatiens TaxID=169438 RepID=UPI000409641C|nr:BamA/TamA family outer membrane protein [Saccharospirillum impatiens]